MTRQPFRLQGAGFAALLGFSSYPAAPSYPPAAAIFRPTNGAAAQGCLYSTVEGQFNWLLRSNALCKAIIGCECKKLPSGSVRIVVGFPAGGGTDILAHIVANKLNVMWGIPVVVGNKVGAAGLIAAREVMKAAPDGQTLMMGHINALGISPTLVPKLGLSPNKDITAIVLVGSDLKRLL